MAVYQVGDQKWEIPDDTPQDVTQRILNKLAHEQLSPVTGGIQAATKGTYTGLANVLGAPVDLVTAGLNVGARATGLPEIESPVGGSEFFKGALGSKPVRDVLGYPLTYQDIEEVPERYRPVARGGEVLGESLPFAAAPLAKGAQLGARAAKPSVVSPIIESARKTPGQFAAAEAAGAAGASGGAAVAEAAFPGRPLVKTGAEIVGGTLAPFSIFARTATGISDGLKNVVASLTPAGRERAAGKRATQMIESLGEDPAAVEKALREQAEVGAPYTSGQKTGSPALLALERKLIQESAKFGLDVQQQTRGAIEEVNRAFRAAAESGDPDALRELAKARRDYWGALIDARMQVATTAAEEAAESVRPGLERPHAGQIARRAIEDALEDARAYERELWGQVPKNIEVEPVSMRQTYATQNADLLPGETLNVGNRAILTALDRWAQANPTSGELLRLRGRMLAEMRRIAGSQAPDWDAWGRLNKIQRSILDDLGSVDAAAETARDFSVQLHDRFTRTVAGKALGQDPRGGERIRPEQTLEKTITGTGQERALAAQELEEAVSPFGGLPNRGRVAAMRAAQEDFIRDLAMITDPSTGQLNPNALGRFRDKNRELLERFPELERTLRDAETTTRVYGNRVKTLQKRDKVMRQRSAFAKVLEYENPKDAINSALRGKTPTKDLDSIFRMAKTRDAKAGARGAFFEAVFENATDSRGLISGTKVLESLQKHSALLKRRGILNDDQIGRVQRIAEEATKLENALAFSGRLDEVAGDTSSMFDLLTRVVGANIGSHSAVASASGAQLVMAGYGSRAARQWLQKVPQTRMKDVLMEAVQNPQLMADLLAKPATEAAAKKVHKRIHAYLLQTGIIEEED